MLKIYKTMQATTYIMEGEIPWHGLPEILPEYEENSQEDAHEFLRALLDRIDDCSLVSSLQDQQSLSENSIVKQVFGGRLRSQVYSLG